MSLGMGCRLSAMVPIYANPFWSVRLYYGIGSSLATILDFKNITVLSGESWWE
jgi:hypothetical protein